MKPIIVEWKNSHIKREEVIKTREKTYLFGDNLLEKGSGGMASEIRGEINSVGIPTKKAPNMKEDSFFSDDEFSFNVFYIYKSFLKIPKNKDIVVPSNIGRGLAEMDKRCPITYKYLTKLLSSLSDQKFSWVDDIHNPKIGLAIYTIHSLLQNRQVPDINSLIPKIK